MKPVDHDKLAEVAERAQKLRSLQEHPGWEEILKTLQAAQEILDRTLLAQARSGTLSERETHRYEDTSKAYRLFREGPEKAVKALENLIRKAKEAQLDEGVE